MISDKLSSIYAPAPGAPPVNPTIGQSNSELEQKSSVDKLIKPGFERISNLESSAAILAELTQNQKTINLLESMENVI